MSGLDNWIQTPPGRYALTWEQAQFDAVVTDIFGYHALQLGLPAAIDALAANRMPHRWRAAPTIPAAATNGHADAHRVALVTNPAALPFAQASLDLIALPHALDCGPDPRAVLREVERVLVHEGRVVMTGINRSSPWGLLGALPKGSKPVSPHRLHALLGNMDLELETVRYGARGRAPHARQDDDQARPGWLDRWGARLWPTFGALWCAVAVKRSRGAMLVGPAWKNQPAAANAQAGVAQRTEPSADSR